MLAEAILAAFRSVGVERDLPAVAPERDSPARRALLKAWYLVRIVPNGIQGENDEEVERAQGEAADEDDGADAIVVGSRRR